MEFKYSYFSNYTVWIDGQQYYLYNAVVGPKQEPYLAYQQYIGNTLINVWITYSNSPSSSLSVEANDFCPNQRNTITTRQVTSSSH